MDDVRGDFLGPPHSTTPVAVIANKTFKNSEHINEKGDGPCRAFGYLSLFSDPIRFGNMEQKRITVILHPSTIIIQMGPNIINIGYFCGGSFCFMSCRPQPLL